jgi:hypothetical protein
MSLESTARELRTIARDLRRDGGPPVDDAELAANLSAMADELDDTARGRRRLDRTARARRRQQAEALELLKARAR